MVAFLITHYKFKFSHIHAHARAHTDTDICNYTCEAQDKIVKHIQKNGSQEMRSLWCGYSVKLVDDQLARNSPRLWNTMIHYSADKELYLGHILSQ
jgi:hypothetical protein